MKMDKPVEELFGPSGSGPFYDKVTGAAVREKGFHQVGGDWYYTDENGNKLLGLQEIDGNSIISIIQSLQA